VVRPELVSQVSFSRFYYLSFKLGQDTRNAIRLWSIVWKEREREREIERERSAVATCAGFVAPCEGERTFR